MDDEFPSAQRLLDTVQRKLDKLGIVGTTPDVFGGQLMLRYGIGVAVLCQLETDGGWGVIARAIKQLTADRITLVSQLAVCSHVIATLLGSFGGVVEEGRRYDPHHIYETCVEKGVPLGLSRFEIACFLTHTAS